MSKWEWDQEQEFFCKDGVEQTQSDILAALKALEERAGLATEMAEYLAKVAISNLYKVVFDVPWHQDWLARYDALKAKEGGQ